jgi:hypothetical protein
VSPLPITLFNPLKSVFIIGAQYAFRARGVASCRTTANGRNLIMEDTPSSESTATATTTGAEAAPRPKLKSLKFLYVGLAWAFGYPATACLIGYAVVLVNGGPTVA